MVRKPDKLTDLRTLSWRLAALGALLNQLDDQFVLEQAEAYGLGSLILEMAKQIEGHANSLDQPRD